MDWGMKNRLSRIMKNGKCLLMPIDHGYFQGPTSKLERPGETIKPLLPYSDALFVTRGVLRACVRHEENIPIILRVSGGTSMIGEDLANEGITTSIKEAVRLNASAVGMSIFVGSKYEHQTLHYNALEQGLKGSNIYQIGLRNDNLMNLYINMDMNATLADSYSSRYSTYNIQLSRFFREVFNLSFNSSYMQSKYDLVNYTDNIITYAVSGYFALNRRWNLSVSYEGRQANDYNTNTIFSRVSYSF